MIRYPFIQNKVLNIYRSMPVIQFPIDIKQALSLYPNCRILSYQTFAEINQCTVDDVIILCESKSGCTHYDVLNNRFLILYNNLTIGNNNSGRQLWTCGHEFGHIACGHMDHTMYAKLAENGFFNNFDEQFEQEADYFAATFLAPFPLFDLLAIKSPTDIQNVFGLSCEASLYRFKKYLHWKDHKIKSAWENDMIRTYINKCNNILS